MLPKRGAVRSLADIDAPVVIASLPSSEALQDTCEGLSHKCIVVETSTLPIEDKASAKEVLRGRSITLLDCPLSGTGAQAKTKDLVVLGSGDRKAFNKVVPVLRGFARSHYYLGEFGNGTKMKLVANLRVAIHNVSAAEAFVLAMKAGLDPKRVYKVIGDGAGSSRMFQVRGPMMVAGRYEPATMKNEVWRKDMQIVGEFAARLGAKTPLFSAAAPLYEAALAQGFGKADTAAVCAVLEALSGLTSQGLRP
ncbi:MAG: NAD(P)-dependent oxidoreductase [Betaproteobacteria bacterium]